jgi:hypothetical protein
MLSDVLLTVETARPAPASTMAKLAPFSETRFNHCLNLADCPSVHREFHCRSVAKHQDVMASRRDLESPLGHSTLIPKRDVLLDAYNVKRYT